MLASERLPGGRAVEFLAFNGQGNRLIALVGGAVFEIAWLKGRATSKVIFNADASAVASDREGNELLVGDRSGRTFLLTRDGKKGWRHRPLREPGVASSVVAVAFAPNRVALAVIGGKKGGEVELYELDKPHRKGADVQTYKLRPAEAPSQVFVVGDRAVLVGAGGAPEVWALAEKERQQTALFRLDAAGPGAVVGAASERGLVFTSDPSGVVRAWNLEGGQGEGAWVLDDHNGERIEDVALSSNEGWLASAAKDGVLVYGVGDWLPSKLPSSERVAIQALAFSPDGEHLAAVGDGEVLVWRMRDLTGVPWRGTHDEVQHVAWGQRLVSAGASSVVVWEVNDGVRRASEQPFEQAFDGAITHLVAGKSAGGKSVVAAATWHEKGSSVHLGEDGRAVELGSSSSSAAVKGLALSPNMVLAVGYADGQVRQRSPGETELQDVQGGAAVQALAYSPQGDLVIGDEGKKVRLIPSKGKPKVVVGDGLVGAVAAGTEAVVWAEGSRVKLWRLDLDPGSGYGERVINLGDHGGTVRRVVAAQSGTLAVSASEDGTVRVWPLTVERLKKRVGLVSP
ncbi:MAG TPA: WD40 repeat domain-containing protein [Nannocystaceae bacterium]|nr:WD40 repeat domain-containing protein [Nannocystaceae bacterium]